MMWEVSASGEGTAGIKALRRAAKAFEALQKAFKTLVLR